MREIDLFDDAFRKRIDDMIEKLSFIAITHDPMVGLAVMACVIAKHAVGKKEDWLNLMSKTWDHYHEE